MENFSKRTTAILFVCFILLGLAQGYPRPSSIPQIWGMGFLQLWSHPSAVSIRRNQGVSSRLKSQI